MHSSIIAAALFAGLAIGNPVKRSEVEVVDVVTQVVVVTSTAGRPGPSSPPAAPAPPPPGAKFVVVPAPAPAPPPAPAPKATSKPAPASVPAPPAAAPVSAPQGGSLPDGADWRQVALFHHNQHRANHSASAMSWDPALEASAKVAADSCVFEHKMNINGGGYGQNIANGNTAAQIGNTISDQFYNGELNLYPQSYGSEPDMGNFHEWGHFSQIVWDGSTKVGCAVGNCPGQAGNSFTVCNYSPPGNMGGAYGKNVKAPKGMKVLTGSGK